MKTMNVQQLEFSLPKIRFCRSRRPRQTRARWWFDRMRQIIDLAPAPRPLPPSSVKALGDGESDGNGIMGEGFGTTVSESADLVL